jgi:hypothetical protein
MRRPVLSLGLVLLLSIPAVARAIPAFARRYRVSCLMCHAPVPRLTAFGEQFAANGYRMSPDQEPTDTIGTGDPLLALARDLPIAMRLDAYVQAYSKGQVATDFAAPYLIKVLASGPLSRTLSYYMYVNLLERGEFGGFEDAILIANDLAGRVDASLGQFQVSDPLFKRELRLEYEDYVVYRARMGDSPVDLTYDRGLLAAVDVLGFGVTGQALNGNGRGPAGENRRFDSDFGKNFALHVTRDLAAGVRVGAFGYYGRTTSESVRNETTMLGVDATLSRGPLEVNLQYLHRNDDRPTFGTVREPTDLDGGFAELLVRPQGSRWNGFALYNLVNATDPLLSLRLGEAEPLDRYETVTGGVGYLLRRNFRVTGEATHDLEQGGVRWTLGFVSAF